MTSAQPWQVLLTGGGGGLLGWVYAQTVGQPVALVWWQAIPAGVLLGAGASFAGVYLLANTDVRDAKRCLALAMICGFAWKPVYEAGTALVRETTARQDLVQEVRQLSQASDALTHDIARSAPGELPGKIQEAERTAAALDDASRRAERIDPAIAAELRLKQAEALGAAAAAAPGLAPVSPMALEGSRRSLMEARRYWSASSRDAAKLREVDLALKKLDASRVR